MASGNRTDWLRRRAGQVRPDVDPPFQLGNAPCRLPDFGKTVIWILMQQDFGKRGSVLVALAVEIVRL